MLYIVPRPATDALLPIRITPQPTELVRTMVGRIEVLTPSAEQATLDEVLAAKRSAAMASDVVKQLGRFAEPKLRRADELMTDMPTKEYLQGLITHAANEG